MSAPNFEDRPCQHVNPELFFTDRTEDQAKAVCAPCPVRSACLGWALTQESDATRYGVFGGMSPTDRRRLTRLNRKALAS